MSNQIKLLMCALTVTFGVVGCDRQQDQTPADEGAVEQQLRQGFTWRLAAESTPEQAQAALGDLQGCDPSKRLPLAGPTNRQRWLAGEPFCNFEAGGEAGDERPSAYRVSAIAYSSSEPAIIVLEPREAMQLSAEVLEAFELPELPVEQHAASHPGIEGRQATQYRQKTVPSSTGEVIGVDAVSHHDDKDRLDEVRVYVTTSDEMVPHVIGKIGPQAARRGLVLPITSTNLMPAGGAYAELGRERVQLGAAQQFPVRSELDRGASPQEFAASALAEPGGDWRKKITTFLQAEEARERKLGRQPDRTLTFSADHLTPAAQMRRFMAGAKAAGIARFKLVGRNVAPEKMGRAGYGAARVINVGLGAPSERGPLGLALELGIEGINLTAADTPISPARGCPKSGPTLCVRGDVDVAAKFDEARALQNKGELDAAQEAALEGLDAYDWAGLYERLVQLKEEYPRATVLRVRLADDQVPVAALVRAMDVARDKLRAPETEASECADAVEDNQALLRSQPCTTGHQHVALFEHPLLLTPPGE